MKQRSWSVLSSVVAAFAAFACGGGRAASPPPTGPSIDAPPTPAAVVAAERAFAADGLARGVKASFLAHSAGDAILIQPDPVNAHEALSKQPDPPPGRPALEWWPVWAGISRSNDLGFTTGPFAIGGKRRGHYFTVWKKQPDGGWKWVFDGGVDSDPAAEGAAGSPVGYLAPSTAASSSPEAAIAEVRALEEAMARRAATDLAAAYVEVLADDGRVHTPGQPPARDRAAFAAAIAARAPAMTLAPLGGGASAAGDLVWTYGDARWDGAARSGHVVRVWQNRAGGWRLVFDELLPRREP
jgi:ketosteroid isomerase-like protein